MTTRQLTPDYLRNLCRRTFPDRPNQQLAEMTPINSRQHEMVAFELWWYTSDGITRHENLIARRYVSTLSWWRPDDRGKAQREATIVRWLYERAFPVPAIYAREFGVFGDVALFAKLQGQDLSFTGRSLSATVSPYVQEAARMLAQLHSFEPTEEVVNTLPNASLTWALANLAAIAAQIDETELRESIDTAMGYAYDVAESTPVILHGDYHFLNMLLYDGRITGLVDWEYSALGDPRWDVANAYMQLVDFGAAEAAAMFLDVYTEASGRTFEGRPLFNVVTPLQQWAISEWLVQKQDEGEDVSFGMAQDLISLRDVHKRRAKMAMNMLD